jgi:hypothetical protein
LDSRNKVLPLIADFASGQIQLKAGIYKIALN